MIDIDVISRARQANLAEYLQRKGERLVRENGENFHLAEHDSLKITGNRFYWFSQGYGGNSLDFVMKYYGLDFKAAVEELTDVPAVIPFHKPTTYEAKAAELPVRAENEKRVIAYLIQKRGLNYSVITDMISLGLLYQDERGNCVFVIKDFFDERGIGYELCGTTDARFKKTSAHKGYGFHILCGKNVDSILFFESAIDLLSYYQFYRPYQNELLVSMGGLTPSVVENAAALFPEAEIVICSDNDEAGEDFWKRTSELYPDRTRRKSPPEERGTGSVKDWNDFLRKRTGFPKR